MTAMLANRIVMLASTAQSAPRLASRPSAIRLGRRACPPRPSSVTPVESVVVSFIDLRPKPARRIGERGLPSTVAATLATTYAADRRSTGGGRAVATRSRPPRARPPGRCRRRARGRRTRASGGPAPGSGSQLPRRAHSGRRERRPARPPGRRTGARRPRSLGRDWGARTAAEVGRGVRRSGPPRSAALVPGGESLELGREDDRLDGVEPGVDADDLVDVLVSASRALPSNRTRSAISGSLVVTAPASPAAPRFLPG